MIGGLPPPASIAAGRGPRQAALVIDRLAFYLKQATRSLRRDGRRRSLPCSPSRPGSPPSSASRASACRSRTRSPTTSSAHIQADIVVSVTDRGGGTSVTVNADAGEVEPFRSRVFTPSELEAFARLEADDGFADSTFLYLINPDRPSFLAPAKARGPACPPSCSPISSSRRSIRSTVRSLRPTPRARRCAAS